MNERLVTGLIAACVLTLLTSGTLRADAPATSPTDLQAGDIDLKFAQRSPKSSRLEIARRLKLKETDLGEDYDLAQRPFKAYVPSGFDPATPAGIIVYLGYKDTLLTPPQWHPLLDKAKLIFISPVCHSGMAYQPTVPLWQSIGLAMDAVYNLKQRCAIDENRVYLMNWNNSALQMDFALADMFSGFISASPNGYYKKVFLPNRMYMTAGFPQPPMELLAMAKNRGYFIAVTEDEQGAAILAAQQSQMKQDGFTHVMSQPLSLDADLHYPNLSVSWLEQNALPFFAAAPQPHAQTAPADTGAGVATHSGTPTTSPSPQPAPPVSEAQRLLKIARLYISSGHPDLAKPKLQQIIDKYPTDPAATEARKLLDQIQTP